MKQLLQSIVDGTVVLTLREEQYGICKLIEERLGKEAYALFTWHMFTWPDAIKGNKHCPIEGNVSTFKAEGESGLLWVGTGLERRKALAAYVLERI